jgi:hypothetical protein
MKTWVLTILVCVSGNCHTITQTTPTMLRCVEKALALAQVVSETPETKQAAQKISCEWKDEE